MSIYVKVGLPGQIKTTPLPSGDMVVAGPETGPLEQIMFSICRWDGLRRPAYGGWIIPSSRVGKIRSALASQCQMLTE